MSSSTGAPSIVQHERQHQPARVGLRRALVTASLALLLAAGPSTAFASSEPAAPSAPIGATPPASSSTAVQAQPQLVFTMGTVAKLDQNAVTLRFEDGQTETYRVGAATTIQKQDGGAATFADLDV